MQAYHNAGGFKEQLLSDKAEGGGEWGVGAGGLYSKQCLKLHKARHAVQACLPHEVGTAAHTDRRT